MWGKVDLALRFLFVAALPFVLYNLAAIIPITGVVIGACLAVAVALIGAGRWRARVEKIPVAGRFLANMARVGDYYDQHPARPVIFYILYPLVLPYVLFNRRARTELLLFRKLNIVALLILVGTNAWEYFRHWYGELPSSDFFGTALGIFILQVLATAMLIMPLATTVVVLRQHGRRWGLVALVPCAAIGLLAMTFALGDRVDRTSTWTSARLYARTRSHPDEAQRALARGLDAAAAWPKTHRLDVKDARAVQAALVEIERTALDALEPFFLPDEAAQFHLISNTAFMLLYAKRGMREPIWLGYAHGTIFHDPARIPQDLRAGLRLE